MNVRIKEMKLIFRDNVDTWDKVVTDLNGNVVYEQLGLKLFPEHRTKEYFDGWETQMKQIPQWNIVKVERFI